MQRECVFLIYLCPLKKPLETRPLISVIVPCYNQAQFLSDALQSVLNQSYQNWECIIVNDGSPDDTESVAQEWCRKDKRCKYLDKKNEGVSAARNAGISIAEGEYILPLDGDDKISGNYIEECVKEFERNPQTKLVYSKAAFFGDKEGEWNLSVFDYRELLIRNVVYCSAMYKKLDWKKTGGYDETMLAGLEDWEFWLSFISPDDAVTCLQNTLFYYRIKAVSRNSNLNANEQEIQQVFNYVYQKHAKKINQVIKSPLQIYYQLEVKNNEINQIETGAKSLGIFGKLMLRTLRKVGRSILNKQK